MSRTAFCAGSKVTVRIMPGASADGDIHMFAKAAFNRLTVKASTFENGLMLSCGHDSTNLNPHPPDFGLNVAVTRLLAELSQVRILGEPGEIAIAEVQCLFQGKRRRGRTAR